MPIIWIFLPRCILVLESEMGQAAAKLFLETISDKQIAYEPKQITLTPGITHQGIVKASG
jgi:hypothetical protein